MATPRDDVKSSELDEPTILDVLNEHCWHAVLDYLDIDDLVRSERVSRRWQRMVHEYLPGVKCYDFTPKYDHIRHKHYRKIKMLNYEALFRRGRKEMFRKILNKLSPYIVKLFLGFKGLWETATVIKITFEMEKLEDLTFWCTGPEFIESVDLTNCKRLKRVAFESCPLIFENDLEKFISNLDIEELSLKEAHNISGDFMINLQTNIKYLTLSSCSGFEFITLHNAQLLSQLKKLELNGYKQRNYKLYVNMLMLAIPKLTELKEFSMNYIASDVLLEGIALGCKQLRSLHIELCGVSGAAVVSLCHELPQLAELNVAGCRHLTDGDLISCITIAKNLTMLDASYCFVSDALLAGAALDVSRRPRTFRLWLTCVLPNIEKMYEQEKRLGLLYIFDAANSMTLIDTSISLAPKTYFDVTLLVYAIDSSEDVKALPLKGRKCVLPTDQGKGMSFYERCISIHMLRQVSEYCKCLPFEYTAQELHIADYQDCTWERYLCVYEMLEKTHADMTSLIHASDCYQKCDYVEYENELDYMKKQRDVGDQNNSYTSLTVHFGSNTCMKYRREVLYTWDQMLANLGGIFGLCLGGSIVSIIEVVWFFIDLLFTALLSYSRKTKVSPPARKIAFITQKEVFKKIDYTKDGCYKFMN